MQPKNAPIQMPHKGHVPHGIHFRVPWRIHEKAWRQYAQRYHGQSAEQLAERGGFGLEELIYLLAGEDPLDAKDDPMASGFFGKFDEK